MPIYRNHDYYCPQCGYRWEKFEERDAPSNPPCPSCATSARRLFGVPAVHGTDTLLMAGSDDGFGEDNASRQIALAKARAAGLDVSGMKYHPGLCPRGESFSPQAWYQDGADVKRKAMKLGRNVEGSINVTSPVFDEDLAAVEKPYRVARHVVEPDVEQEIETVYGGRVNPEKREELFEKHQDAHSGSKQPTGKVDLFP